MPNKTRDECRLVEAALVIKKSYNATQRLITLGLLKGRRDDAGNWWVDSADLTRLAKAEASDPTVPGRVTTAAMTKRTCRVR
jgi:hypothetical protein